MKIDGEFFKAGADASGFFEPTDALFDHATAAIGHAVKFDATVMPGVFVFLVRDDGPDAPGAEPLAYAIDAVGFIASQAAGTKTRPAQGLRNAERVEQRFDA